MPKGLQCCEDHCKFFNGALHWIVRDESSTELICAFEIVSQRFGFVDPPVTFGPMLGLFEVVSVHVLATLWTLGQITRFG